MSVTHKSEWQIASDDIAVPMAQIGVDGAWLNANPSLSDLVGYSFDELVTVPFDQLFQPENGQQENQFRERLLNGAIPRFSCERKARRKDGTLLPVRIIFSLVHDSEQSFLAVMEDLTNLRFAGVALRESETARHELARRLTNAQEKERTRIARELHDDIGQSLAILRIQMLRSGQPVSGLVGKRHPTIPELCDNLKHLAEKVSRISHQLHSSELEYLGLAVAIQSHCREFSARYKIAVECSCTDVPENLNSLLALSLLRIVQEALHNAAKHSRAKSMQVAVWGSATELSLSISDDGAGFDPEEAKLAAGLGLISMRERVHLAGGEFQITSKLGEGTLITARVPLSQTDARAASATAE